MNGDILTDVLQAVRLSGAIFFDLDASSPWVSEAPSGAQLAPLLMPGVQHVIEYHVIIDGACWAGLLPDDAGAIRLERGSIIVFPRGDPHVLSSAPGMRAAPDWEILRAVSRGKTLPVRVQKTGNGTEEVSLICGFLGCDALPYNPLLQALPRLIHIADAYTAEEGWLKTLIEATITESRDRRVGGAGVLAKLSELIFIEVVRRYMESLPREDVNWLTALSDPQMGRAIRLLHDDVRHPWTLASLAQAVGVSRTVLVERFNTYLGMAPMSYLSNWRMQVAAGMLAGGSCTLTRIADSIGYSSEAAFSRAFKRFTGMPPAQWRENQAIGDDSPDRQPRKSG